MLSALGSPRSRSSPADFCRIEHVGDGYPVHWYGEPSPIFYGAVSPEECQAGRLFPYKPGSFDKDALPLGDATGTVTPYISTGNRYEVPHVKG